MLPRDTPRMILILSPLLPFDISYLPPLDVFRYAQLFSLARRCILYATRLLSPRDAADDVMLIEEILVLPYRDAAAIPYGAMRATCQKICAQRSAR